MAGKRRSARKFGEPSIFSDHSTRRLTSNTTVSNHISNPSCSSIRAANVTSATVTTPTTAVKFIATEPDLRLIAESRTRGKGRLEGPKRFAKSGDTSNSRKRSRSSAYEAVSDDTEDSTADSPGAASQRPSSSPSSAHPKKTSAGGRQCSAAAEHYTADTVATGSVNSKRRRREHHPSVVSPDRAHTCSPSRAPHPRPITTAGYQRDRGEPRSSSKSSSSPVVLTSRASTSTHQQNSTVASAVPHRPHRRRHPVGVQASASAQKETGSSRSAVVSSSSANLSVSIPSQQAVVVSVMPSGGGGGGCGHTSTNSSSNRIHSTSPPVILLPTAGGNVVPANNASGLQRTPSRHRHQAQQALFSDPTANSSQLCVQASDGAYPVPPRNTNGGGDQYPQTATPVVVMPVDLTVPSLLHSAGMSTTSQPAGTASAGPMSSHFAHGRCQASMQPVVNLMHHCPTQPTPSHLNYIDGGYSTGVLSEDGLPCPSLLVSHPSALGPTIGNTVLPSLPKHSTDQFTPAAGVADHSVMQQCLCDTSAGVFQQGGPVASLPTRDTDGSRACSSVVQSLLNPINVARLVSLTTGQKGGAGGSSNNSAAGPSTSSSSSSSSHHRHSKGGGATVSGSKHSLPPGLLSSLDSVSAVAAAAGLLGDVLAAGHTRSSNSGLSVSAQAPATVEYHPVCAGASGSGVVLMGRTGRAVGTCAWSRAPGRSDGLPVAVGHSGINHRIAQLQQCHGERSLQIIILQDINQVLLMGFEENLVNLNFQGLVACVLEILGSEDDQLTEMKNLCCNVLTHMMDVLPRSSDAVVPALPLLLKTMSCSFVGDILERIINLLEQLSRRHGREVLQCGAISSVLEFYDFVTLAQHRTILSMVSNCFVKLGPADFDLIAPCLPSLSERLRESEPGCVERVCSCFVRLALAYHSNPDLLKRIVNSCSLLSNLQHLLMASPSILLRGLRDVLLMLTIFCSSPDLAVELMRQNISVTLHGILTGKPVDTAALTAALLSSIAGLPDLVQGRPSAGLATAPSRSQARSGSGGNSSQTSGSLAELSVASLSSDGGAVAWQPLLLTSSPAAEPPSSICSHVAIEHRSPEDIHALIQLICELLPPIPVCQQEGVARIRPPLSVSCVYPHKQQQPVGDDDSVESSPVQVRRRQSTPSSRKLPGVSVRSMEKRHMSSDNISITSSSSSSSLSTASSCVTLRPALTFPYLGYLVGLRTSGAGGGRGPNKTGLDPRSQLLWDQCESLHARLTGTTTGSQRSDGRWSTGSAVAGKPEAGDRLPTDNNNTNYGLQLVQILLPLLFELFTETTKLQTRALCLDAIRCLLYFSSPILVAKVLNPSAVCSHLVGVLSSPDQNLVLAGLHIALLLVDRVPILFTAYFRKAGIVHQINRLKCRFYDSCELATAEQPTVVHSSSQSIPSLSFAVVENALPPAYDFAVRLQLSTNRDNLVPGLNNNSRLLPSLKHQSSDTPPRETSESDITWFIGVSCYQLQHQIYQIIPSILVLNATSPSVLNDRDVCKTKQLRNSLSLPPLDHDLAFLDLMPKLSNIASHLNSAKPASWVFAFKELVDLLKPFPCGSASRLEPPSPFELHNSGVTAALLAYLTEMSHRETRLWIFYRLFFGARARADRCLLPLSSQGPTSKRKQQHQTRLSFPSQFSLSKLDALYEIDEFLTSHGSSSAAPSPGTVDEGPKAFSSLINCLLTCFHRHEHFQVSSVPSALSPDSELFSLIHQSTVPPPPQPAIPYPTTSDGVLTVNGQDNSLSACQRTVASVGPRPRRQTSRLSAVTSTKTPDDQHSTCRQPITDSSGALAGGHEAALNGVLMSMAEVKHLRSGLTAAGISQGSPAPSDRRSLPTAGLLTIELVQLPTEDTAAAGDRGGSGTSATSPTSQTGGGGGGVAGAAKSGRKSSASSSPSSTSSNHSSTSSTLTMDSLVSLPSPLRIQITALATVQTLERLLLQRHSINALLQDYSTFHDHDYGAGLFSLANAYGTQSLQGVSDTRMSDDGNSLDEEQANPISSEPAVIIMGGTRHRHHHRTKEALKRASQVMAPADQLPINSHHYHHPVVDSNDPEAANHLTGSRRLYRSRSRQPDESDCHLTSLLQSRLAVPSEAISLGDSCAATGPVYSGLRSLLQRGEFPLSSSIPAESVDQLLLSSDTGTASKPVSSRTLRRRSNVNSSNVGGGTRDRGSSSTADPAAVYPPRHSFEVTGAIDLSSAPAGVSCSLVSDASSAPIYSRLSKAKQTLIGAPKGSVSTNPGNTGTNAGSSSRQRRLRGSSLLAAFGMLSGLSSSSSYSQQHTADRSGSSSMGGEVPKGTGRRSTPSKHHSGGGPVVATSLYSNHPVGVSPSTSCLPSPSSSTSSSNSSVISLDSRTFNTGCGSSGVSGGALSSSSLRMKQHRPSFVFYVAGHQLPADMPLFEAIRSFSLELFQGLSELSSQAGLVSKGNSTFRSLSEADVDELTGHLIWSLSHVIHYRLIHNIPSSSTNHCGHYGNPTSKASQGASNHSAFGSFLHRSTGSGISGTSTATANNNSATAIAAAEPGLATSTSSLSSMITCLKRRRQDEQDSVAAVDKPIASLTAGSSQSSSPASPPHPLYTSLTSKACEGFLDEKRCACVPSQCPGGANNELALAAPSVDASLFGDTIAGTLTVLRLLHSVSRLWHTGYDMFDPFPIVSPTVFRSQKLAAKANRQLQDLFSVLAGNLPNWLIQLVSTSPFLFPFETRRCFFYAYNFDRDRALLRFQDSASASSGSEFELTQSNVLSPRSQTATAASSAFSSSLYPASSTVGATAAVGLSLDHHLLSLVGPNYAHQQQADHHRSGGSAAPSRRGYRGRFHLRLALSPNLRRHKVTVDREGKRLLRQAETILTDLSGSRAVLEIAFEGEVGFGLGPTLEFYTLVSRQLMKASLGLWHPGGEPTDEGYLVAPAPGLYPRPLGNKQTRSSVAREIRSKFLFLGRLMARALLDWRQLDLSFSPAFFKWFLSPTVSTAVSEGHILPTDLSLVDPDLARHMVQLVELANRRYRISRRLRQEQRQQSSHPQTQQQSREAKSSQTWRGVPASPEKLKEALAALDSEVDDLCLNFVLPGYEIDLVKNGSHVAVTGANLADYLRLVSHWFVIEGAHRQMEAVLEGFDSVLPGVRRRLAVIFQPDEVAGLFCGRSTSQFELFSDGSYKEVSSTIVGLDDEGWDIASLTEACRCDHGYTPQSRTIRALFEVMSEFDARQRRLFVQFITGSPRLPVGGFRALKPPLKIVMKREHVDSADNHLPSVMTCQNYLKLPDYSSKELLRSKLLYAIHEGQNAFHLS